MVKIVIIAIIIGCLTLYLKTVNPEIATMTLIAGGVMILVECFSYLTKTYEFFNQLISYSGVDSQLFLIIFKAVGIGYLIEFGAGLLEDFGLKSLSDKLILFGKIVILTMSLPILYAILNVIKGML